MSAILIKPSDNPKRAAGLKKVPLSCGPQAVFAEVHLNFLDGGFKYDLHNYRLSDIRASDYMAAHRRHIILWEEFGETYDDAAPPGAKIAHLSSAIACLCILRDAEMRGMLIDDRPPKMPKDVWKAMEENARIIREFYGKPDPDRVTELSRRGIDLVDDKRQGEITGAKSSVDASKRGVGR